MRNRLLRCAQQHAICDGRLHHHRQHGIGHRRDILPRWEVHEHGLCRRQRLFNGHERRVHFVRRWQHIHVGREHCQLVHGRYGAGERMSTAYAAGTASATGTNGVCTQCAAGTFTTAANTASTCSACSNAALGYYYSSFGTSATCPTASCTNAVAGTDYYTASGAAAGTSATCPAASCAAPATGQYVTSACITTANTGLATARTVQDCTAGTYLSAAFVAGSASQAGSDGVCSPCSPGRYSSSGAASCSSWGAPGQPSGVPGAVHLRRRRRHHWLLLRQLRGRPGQRCVGEQLVHVHGLPQRHHQQRLDREREPVGRLFVPEH